MNRTFKVAKSLTRGVVVTSEKASSYQGKAVKTVVAAAVAALMAGAAVAADETAAADQTYAGTVGSIVVDEGKTAEVTNTTVVTGKTDVKALKSSKAPTNYFTPNILRKSWSRLVVSVVHLDALAFPVAAT